MFTGYILPGRFIRAKEEDLTWDEYHYRIGWQVVSGFDMEVVNLRTRNDDNDIEVVIAREDGIVKAVSTRVKCGSKEFGW